MKSSCDKVTKFPYETSIMKKIDIYNHIWPPAFYDRVVKLSPNASNMTKRVRAVPMITDLDVRFKVMDMFDNYLQILSLASPPLEMLVPEPDVADLARLANDSMAELVQNYPERFPGFIASLPLTDPEAAVLEAERAIRDLHAVGVQGFTNVQGKSLDGLEFRPLFQLVSALGKPVWIHPSRGPNFPDYLAEDHSKYEIWWAFGWPYETSVCMARMVFSKLFDEFPDLKIITHHGGGMIPYFEGRVGYGWDQLGARTTAVDYSRLLSELQHRPLDYFRRFIADTATFGSDSATRCALDFFGVDNIVFASDAPFDPEQGPLYIRETIRVIDSLDISEADREKIYHGNAIRLCGLPEGVKPG